MSRPDVSIVLLTWNRAPFLEICLREMFSALSSELSREIIIMDNCSDDSTPQILGKYTSLPNVKIVRNRKNLRLNAYKKLFPMARGRYIIEVDDDILRFPKGFDKTLVDYIEKFSDYGFLALNVEQNDKTDGAKPRGDCYHDDIRDDMTVEEGPTGGWCTIFRRWHYQMIRPILAIRKFTMAQTEDGALAAWIMTIFRKRIGLIKNAVCLHATGPAYAAEFGLTKREFEKYMMGGRPDLAQKFE